MKKFSISIVLFVLITLQGTVLFGQRVYEVDSSLTFINASSFAAIPGPGDTVRILAPRSKQLKVSGISGDTTKPVVFINSGGQVFISSTTLGALDFVDCKYIKVTGSGDSSFRYGFKLLGEESGLSFSGLSSDCEAEYIEIVGGDDTFFGLYAKKDYHGSPPEPYPQFNNLIVHDLYIHGVSAGMYIGETTSPGMEFRHVRIYNNIVTDTNRESIQIANCVEDVELFNNLMISAGIQNLESQGNALQIGGNSVARVYSNIIVNCPAFGIIVLGIGDIEIFNNYCANSLGIFIDDRYWAQENRPINLHNNYFIDSRGSVIVKNMNQYNDMYLMYNKFNTDIPFFVNEGERPSTLVVKNNSLDSICKLDYTIEDGVFLMDSVGMTCYPGIGPVYSGIHTSERIVISEDQLTDLVEGGSILSPKYLVDEQDLNPTLDQHPLSSPWIPETNLDNLPYSLEIDLGASYYLESIFFHDIEFTGDIAVSILNDGEWEDIFTDSCKNFNAWNYHPLKVFARSIRLTMYSSVKARINEIALYGYLTEGGDVSHVYFSDFGIDSEDRGDCSFYPNPASSYVTVLCSDNHNVIEISNLAGRVLIRTNNNNNNNNNKKKKKKKINVSFLSNGLYLIHSIGIDGAVHLHGKLIVSK